MRSVILFLFFAAVLASIPAGCSKKAEPAAITKFAIGKNAKSDPPANSYEVAEVIYATAKVSNPPAKYNFNFVIFVLSP